MHTRHVAALLFAVLPAALSAQAVVDPGMTKAQVIATLGAPAVQKTSGNATYLYYRNGAERTAGMSDLVVLEGDKVVDAVFRSSQRKYSGTSSSPKSIPAEVARKSPLAGARSTPAGTTHAAPRAATPAPTTSAAAAKESQKMPAQRANEAKAVAPTPQARSAILEQQRAAGKAADSARAAKAADSAKAAKKPDAAAAPPKKP